MTATSPQPDEDRLARFEQLAADLLAALQRVEFALASRTAGDAGTAATVALVIQRKLAEEDLSDVDGFWLNAAEQEMLRKEAERGRVLGDAAAALVAKRFHPARAREVALTVLTASGHPAFTGLLVGAIAGRVDEDEAAGR
jgi:hypothetical protein